MDLSEIKTARSAADRQVAQITVRGKRGYILRTEERSEDLFTSFDRALEKLQRQIERYKGKRERGRGDGKSAAEVAAALAETGKKEPPLSDIVRRKRMKLIPMTEREAFDQMNMLSHEDFFLYCNVETRSVNVIYRRRDGTLWFDRDTDRIEVFRIKKSDRLSLLSRFCFFDRGEGHPVVR